MSFSLAIENEGESKSFFAHGPGPRFQGGHYLQDASVFHPVFFGVAPGFIPDQVKVAQLPQCDRGRRQSDLNALADLGGGPTVGTEESQYEICCRVSENFTAA